MSRHDPRILIRAFDILNEEFSRFNQISSNTLKEAEYTQRCAQERINQANRTTAISLNQAQSDTEDVREVDTEIRGLLSNSGEAVEIAHQTVEKVSQASQQAQTTLSVWQNELQKALAWQARAEERLARAIQEYDRAQRNLASAQQNLASAEASLRSCMNDSERKSCSGEERAYNNARAAVAVAIQELQLAEIEVRAAEEELERARARVRCCRQAVGYAEQAVQHANLATEQANQALNEAERSLESAESANRAITKASTKAKDENELVQQAINQVQQAEGFVTQSQVSVQVARRKADSAYNLAVRGNQELAYRRDQLVHLNQPSSGFWGAVEKGVAAVQIASGLLGGVVAAPVPDGRLFGVQSQDDIVLAAGEAGSSANQENIKRRDEEIDLSSQVSNTPTTSAPPNP
jgi:chromosome segregation ATPase